MGGVRERRMATPRHFLDLDRLDGAELRRILDRGVAYKRGDDARQPLAARCWR